MAIGSKFQIFLIALSAFNLSVYAEDAANSPCDESLLLNAINTTGTSNLTLFFGQTNSQNRDGERAAFETYVKNEKIFNSPLLATAIAWELKGEVYNVGKAEVLQRLRILPVLNDKEQIRSLAQGAAVKLLMLFQDEFDFRETQAVDKMAETLGVRIDELSEILKNWKLESELDGSFEKLIQMIEFLLVHENLRLEARIKNLSKLSFYSLKTRSLLKGSKYWEIFLSFRNEGLRQKDRALFFVSRYLESNNSFWLRARAIELGQYTHDTEFLESDMDEEINSGQKYTLEMIDRMFVVEDPNLKDQFKIAQISKKFFEDNKLFTYEIALRVIENLKLNFMGHNSGYAQRFRSAFDRSNVGISGLNNIWRIPTQMELIYVIIFKLDLHSFSNLQLCYLKRIVIDLTKDILQKWIHWFGSENTAEERADILNFTKYLMDEKIREYKRLNLSAGLDESALKLSDPKFQNGTRDDANKLAAVMEDASKWDAYFNATEALILKSHGSDLVGKHKIENGKFISSNKVFVEGQSYVFEDLPYDLQALIQSKMIDNSLDYSLWAFTNMTADAFTVFSSEAEFLVKLEGP